MTAAARCTICAHVPARIGDQQIGAKIGNYERLVTDHGAARDAATRQRTG